MRAVPPSLQTSLDSGVTTLCWCWRIVRADGLASGFTDHDRDLAFDGVTYAAASAEMTGRVQSESGFSPGSTSMSGVLESGRLDEAELRKGLFDGARVELYRVDWTAPEDRVHMWAGVLGDVRRGETGFEVEVRSRSSALDRTIGRVFQRRCDAVLGEARCGVDLDQPAYVVSGAATSAESRSSFRTDALAAFADGWFSHGAIEWTSGANAGVRGRVQVHRAAVAEAVLKLSVPAPADISPGDAFTVRAGCDKRWATCKTKFANTVNFRGFPMIPGDDWLQAGPRSRDRNDGGSLWTDREA